MDKTYMVIALSLTEYIMRCSELMRRDHSPDKEYFNGSGLPMPVNGCSAISSSNAVMRFIIALLPDFIQYFLSSSACSSNIISINRQY